MNSEFDRQIKAALEERVKEIVPSPGMLEEIRKEAAKRGKENKMMKFGMKKIAVVAAVFLMSVTAYAATQLKGVVSHSSNDIRDFAKLEQAEEKMGLDAKYVERFANGFAFRMGGVGEMQGLDEEEMPTGEAYGILNVDYADEKGREVTLTIEAGNPYADAGQAVTEGYLQTANKFVPPDYTLTEEDRAKQAAGELNIAYGAAEVEEKTFEEYRWQADGLYYSLGAFDCNLGEDVLRAMAEEIMQG